MQWVTAHDLQIWAGHIEAEAKLPELVRRLVHAGTIPTHISFPAGESIQTPGWDGVVEGPVAHPYIPEGWSGWELSKRADTTTKANEDYQHRTDDPNQLDRGNTTFVFVTPRGWNGKETWVAEKQALGQWKDVRAYDADDLEQWLEREPAVGAWFARLIGKYPNGVQSGDDYWAEYSHSTVPPFTPDILVADRTQDTERARQWLQHGTGVLHLIADSPREALAFMAASASLLAPEEQARVASRFLVADDATVLRELSATGTDLMIGWLASDTTAIGQATQRGHKVIVPATVNQGFAVSLQLTRPTSQGLVTALQRAGAEEGQARMLVRDTGRSVTELHRRLNRAPALPAWATPAHARELIPALLASAWDEQSTSDQDILALLSGMQYAAVTATMMRWTQVPDAPVQQTGTIWSMRAPRVAWNLLLPSLTRQDIDHLRTAAVTVLGAPDPSLELPAEQRWMANVYGRALLYSTSLREGLAQTIVFISVTPQVATARGADIANAMVAELLHADWQRWYALEPVLPLLAEAAPRNFLDALEELLDRDSLDDLFVATGPMHGDHTAGLLGALELLAWYPDYLARAALILARLAHTHQRPQEVLRAIFLPWLPQTCTTVADRTRVLTLLHEREPEVSWKLLMALWPKNFDHGAEHHQPLWRERPPAPARTMAEYRRATIAVITLALHCAGTRAPRLIDLIACIGPATPDTTTQLREQLNTFSREEHDEQQRFNVWNTLRAKLNEHRSFQDAEWALPEEELALFDPIATLLAPNDVVLRSAWLFEGSHPVLPLPHAHFERIDAALADQRTHAVANIVAAEGTPGIERLARMVAEPFQAGIAAANANANEQDMLRLLASDEEHTYLCAMGYASRRHEQHGIAWVDAMLRTYHDLDRSARTRLLLGLPGDRATWDRVEEQHVVQEYWSRTRAHLYNRPQEDLEYALTHLLAAGQVPQAFEWAGMSARQIPAQLLTQILDRVLVDLQNPERPAGHLVGYHAVQILGALDQRPEVDLVVIARYEWAFLPLLRHQRTLRLHEALANAPSLFGEMVASLHPAGEPTQEDRARAHQAYDLLSAWHRVPGTQDDGNVDQQALFAWVTAARELCAASVDACDELIGRVLAWASTGTDQVWPHESVRALIEHVNSRALEAGVHGGLFTKRGVFTRDPLGGGTQERALANQYATWSRALATTSPRTANILAELADTYERHAHYEDHTAEQRRLRYL